MAKYVFLFRGGNVPNELREKNMNDWAGWIKDMRDKDALADVGAPLNEGRVVESNGSTHDFSWEDDSGVGGYSVVNASSLDEAVALTEGCPQLAQEYGGGSIEVREFIEVAM